MSTTGNDQCPSLLDTLGFLNFPDFDKLSLLDKDLNSDIGKTISEIQKAFVTFEESTPPQVKTGGGRRQSQKRKRRRSPKRNKR
jgi:hypothetical protein